MKTGDFDPRRAAAVICSDSPDKSYDVRRVMHNDLEMLFAEAWIKKCRPRPGINYGNGLVQDLFVDSQFGDLAFVLTDEDRLKIATVVQWLGTNVGFSFLDDVLSKAGYEIIQRRRNRR